MEEIWRVIEGYDYPYEISNMGRVKFPDTKTTKAHISVGNGDRYLRVRLSKDGFGKYFGVHQLVALYFLPHTNLNPDGSEIIGDVQVNHKDENKHNNYVDNLEYCDSKYNTQYGTRIKKIAKRHFKAVQCVETKEIFSSVKSAEMYYNVRKGSISNSANPKCTQQIAGGYHWKYI